MVPNADMLFPKHVRHLLDKTIPACSQPLSGYPVSMPVIPPARKKLQTQTCSTALA
jgi:hypothetical protein